ncbi:hypothetical protein F5I97DRAFT_1926650 [Phlebopus sp. FC_14]|nr:hypothetical protein F5I97DRAFT_1926650 [Phlebopus sp. FC_14]
MSSSSGIFYLMGQTGTYLELASASPGTNVTTWHYTGSSAQQWNLTAYNGPSSVMYTVQNVYTSTYITYSTVENPGVFLTQSLTPFDWYFQPYENGYAISSTDTFELAWNVDQGSSGDNNPVIMYACCDVWTLYSITNTSSSSFTAAPTSATSLSPSSPTSSSNSSTSSSSSGSSTSSTNVPLIVGLSVGVTAGVIIVLGTLLWICCRRGSQHRTWGISKLLEGFKGKAAA